MNKLPLADTELQNRLQELLASGSFDHSGLQPEIAESWERSYASTVDRHSASITCRDPLEENKEFFELADIAIPYMENMYKSLKGSGFQILLADKNGLLVEHFPLEKKSIFQNWSEDILGTNAIGTAIKIKKSIQISGSEHYRYELHSLTSSAVPIFNAQGAVVAVLALTGPRREDHSRILSMLHKTVKMIIYKWKVVQKNRQLLTYNNHLRNIINTMMDGIIIVTETDVIDEANPAAAKILGKDVTELKGAHLGNILTGQPLLSKMLNSGSPFRDLELYLDSPAGKIHCLATGQTSQDENGNVTGGIIVLRSLERMPKIVNNTCGTRATLNFRDVIGSSKAIKETIDMARLAANNLSSVLLQGESGTGKEIFAQAIHNESGRNKGPFVAVNCGAIPRELMGSELFGYADGAFTGARRGGSTGKFEMAAGGTLFLDEIGDMPLDQQVVLLRVLQDKRVTRIGDSKEIPVDVRIICATNKDLFLEVEKGRFRQDLYYRLNVISLTIPPLRDRMEDIPLLVNHFLYKLGVKGDTISNFMNPALMQCLSNYSWPGNVRELHNVIERLAIIADNRTITIDDLPQEIRISKKTCPVKDNQVLGFSEWNESYTQKKHHLIAEQESEQILSMLRKYRGNLSEVAKAMGFSRTTMYRKLKMYNISRDNW